MLTPEQRIRQQAAWFEMAERVGNVRLACIRLGISRKTFYKWRRRFQIAQGAKTALLDRSRWPHRPWRKVKKASGGGLIWARHACGNSCAPWVQTDNDAIFTHWRQWASNFPQVRAAKIPQPSPV